MCLKIKMHTYEVLTRQAVLPKPICMTDDLYNHALPMLLQLEKEFPAMRLRLMGLRCTHLISTKKYDGSFFRPASRPASMQKQSSRDTADDGGWEVWPEEEFEEAVRQERQDEMEEIERLSQEHAETGVWESTAEWHEPFGVYKYGSEQNSPVKPQPKPDPSEETLDCPICCLPQPANDREFNAHIDHCLSKQTIKEAVAESAPTTVAKEAKVSRLTSDVPTRPRSAAGTKRKSSTASGRELESGHTQKKLFFA